MTSLAAKFTVPSPEFRRPKVLRSASAFGSMAGTAYRTSVSYRFSRDPHGRRQALDSFVADLQHRSA